LGRGCFPEPVVGALLALIPLGGCASIGPQRLGIDRADYADHLRETNKEQLLLNIVALRYGDAPLFLEVSSVISQYTREGSASASLRIDPSPTVDDIGGVGAGVVLRETPTVTYTPLSGERFARSLLAPISPASLVGMIESGWSPELLFRVATRSLNGIGNGSRDPLFAQPADPEFEQVLATLGRLQRKRVLTIDVDRMDEGKFSVTGRLAPELSDQDRADIGYIRNALDIHQVGNALRIVFAESATAPDELAIGTRSMFEIFSEMAQGVDVPPADGSRAMPTAPVETFGEPLMRIHSGTSRPADAHAAVRYRGHWFWIAGDDVDSKRMFLVAQILLSLNDTSGSANAPVVTIPTG
jgi:hypothetical protein